MLDEIKRQEALIKYEILQMRLISIYHKQQNKGDYAKI